MNIAFTSILFRDTCAENVNITSMAYNGMKTKKYITASALKRLKGARDIILIHNTVYLGDQYMNDGQKERRTK